jgi:hypothetical protein
MSLLVPWSTGLVPGGKKHHEGFTDFGYAGNWQKMINLRFFHLINQVLMPLV